MRLSIITPTIVRPTLLRLCSSVDDQTFTDYEHLLLVDRHTLTPEQWSTLQKASIWNHRRKLMWCPLEHHDYGHGCRNYWIGKAAQGDYVLNLDDDDYLMRNDALADLRGVTTEWAIFPTESKAGRFYNDPPGACMTNVSNYIVKRELAAAFPAGGYGVDGEFVESLKQHEWQSLPGLRPLVWISGDNRGRMETE